MALTNADISRLKTLTNYIANSEKKLLQLENETNREIANRNKLVAEFNRINAKR